MTFVKSASKTEGRTRGKKSQVRMSKISGEGANGEEEEEVEVTPDRS